ncbi:hypothetical protein FQV26_04445 [Planococcus sp. CPCC 101016]|uniref:hypothetical protein n=1 Tax=Planococcus sp. CPCC 101016 TaxID=2599617 RepID=UPI0011B72D88|nr:hypothetical protein [Planococcus sp. CPCC 101016]TWT07068.1 hypothetical protein FQV26_04445 [Planococcus sp. CPCC 101016]
MITGDFCSGKHGTNDHIMQRTDGEVDFYKNDVTDAQVVEKVFSSCEDDWINRLEMEGTKGLDKAFG